MSSGIDSPVAGRMMIDKGVEVVALHFKLFDNKKEQEKVIELAKKVGVKQLFFADLRICHDAFQKNANRRFTCVFCKRTMFRIAEKLAKKLKCDFLITGENLGQVASQTLDNMVLIDSSVKIKILSPLLSFDKNDTVKIAKQFSTYELSIKKSPGCPYLPRRPVTRAKKEKYLNEESRVEINKLIDKSYKTVKKVF